MPVLIDGNNLLHAARKVDLSDLEIGRTMLCERLGRWAARRREDVHVVFDGPEPEAARRAQIGHPNLKVTFSGRGISADRSLIELLNSDSAARRLVVVSTDREIARAAKRRRATAVRAEMFWETVTRDLSRPEPAPDEPDAKRLGLSAAEVAEWAAEFGFGPPPSTERVNPSGTDERR